MTILVDTHVLLWAAGERQKLSPKALAVLEEPGQTPWFSAASERDSSRASVVLSEYALLAREIPIGSAIAILVGSPFTFPLAADESRAVGLTFDASGDKTLLVADPAAAAR